LTEFNLKNQRLLVIAPHSDDEVLGCGGLISKIKNEGGKVFVLIFNLGFEKDDTKESQEKRKNEVREAMNVLKVDDYHLVHDQPDNNRDLDIEPLHSLIEVIENTSNVSLEKIAPTIVAIPTIFSHHQDHVHVHHACIAALRPISTPVSNIVLSYEAPEHSRWSASGVFEPNLFVEIDDVIENKIVAFNKYQSQIRPGGRDADNIRNQAKYRGQEVGKNLCEAFFVHRFIL
jgi:LmbE family N-acetylglucosaminyl deacetylase